ncbi:Endoribonuclease dcr-1 [Dirofilaria immitis]
MVVRASDVDKDFFTPRDYQVELLDKACKKNIIVPLGTGSGKTFIAVLLIKEYTTKLVIPWKKGGKRAFFLVDKVSLVEQQAAHIEHHTTLNVGKMHGHLNQDIWAAVIILDECHHVLGSRHPYRLIMHRYGQLTEVDRPRVLGLTASLINSKIPPSSLEQLLEKLEGIMHSSIETASDLVSISKYGAKPKEYVIMCHDFFCCACEISKKVVDTLEALRTFCLKCAEFHPEFDIDPRKPVLEAVSRTKSVLEQLGPWCAWKVCQLFQRQLKKHSAQGFLPEKQVIFLQMAYTTMRFTKRLLDAKVANIRCFVDMKPILPDRLARLFEILKFFNPSNMEKVNPDFAFCGIIFVEQRYVAYVLNTLIRAISRWDSDKFGYLVSDFVIGYNNANIGAEETMALHRRQELVLRKFRQRHLNLLVATSVLEEGVDVRQCNVVIRFDRPTDYRAYVQSKGRARKDDASYFLLVEEYDREQCSCDLKDFLQIERMLLKRYQNVHNPSEPVISPRMETVDDIIAPYIVESTGAQVTLTTAISLVNRYCAKLPSDIFTRLVPQNTIVPETVGDRVMYRAELLLPINSPIKEIIKLKKPLESKKLAQMAVALEACKRLHKRKELNDYLLPVGKDTIMLTALDEDPDEFIPNMNYKVGSARRRQLYDKRMAKALHNAIPRVGEECYIYVMEMDLIKAVTGAANPKNRRIINPLDTEFCFGFLSNKKIPKVPSFPLFLRQGRMQANIFLVKSRLLVDAQMLELLKAFHHYLFDNVLRLASERNTDTSEVDFKLDYAYVRNVVSSIDELPRVPTEVERLAFKFDAAKFQDAVVMPWYRDRDHPSFYYVAEIIDAKPSSKFPDDKFATFNDYFIQKYDIIIYDQEQPLLDVDYTSSRLNLLMPRHWSRSRSRIADERGSENSGISQGQILVPELVDVHPIAASLWNVIAALPTLLYRINSLLLADELRELVMREALCNPNYKTSDDICWTPLDYPTPMDDLEMKPVNKDVEAKDPDTGMVDFEIGVWDPELAKGLEDFCLTKARCNEVKGFDDVDGDALGLIMNGSALRQHGDMSDDDDEDAVVLFDFINSVHERLGKESGDIFAPRKNITSSGWDDLVVIEESAPNGINMPLSVNSGDSQIDSRGLMADLSRMSWLLNIATLPLASLDTMNQTNLDVRKETIKCDRKQNPSVARKPAQLYLDSLERLEDSDRISSKSNRQEECIDLIEFCDDMDKIFSNEYNETLPFDLNYFKGCLLDTDVELDTKVLSPKKILHQNGKLMNEQMVRSSSDLELFLQMSYDSDNTKLDCSTVDVNAVDRKHEISAPVLDWITFSFEEDTFNDHPDGVSPCTLLQALTLSNASDGINLERLETVGDSFLKYAITDYLFHMNPEQHEGKLSFARSKEVSNCNLYRLGRKHNLPSLIIGSKFDPNDGWLPPCYAPTSDFKAPNILDAEERDKFIENVLEGKAVEGQEPIKVPTGWDEADRNSQIRRIADGIEIIEFPKNMTTSWDGEEITPLPYNLLTQQSLGDKSIADAVESLIGAHLLELGPTATLKFMKWLGLKVLTESVQVEPPLLRFIDTPEQPDKSLRKLNDLWIQFQFSKLEDCIGYRFTDRAYLLQAFTHASYYKNRITGCYQRLEFLGDAVLDYVITRFLFQHSAHYSPGVLTDLRSALVNNTIFASLAVKYNFHKHFIAMCPRLHHMIEKFVCLCAEKNLSGANFNDEMYMVTTEEEIDEGEEEDIEVPKAMGDIFESVAGAIYLDSGRSLDIVWRVFYNLMKETINECCSNPPRSPIRELLEMEPERARNSNLSVNNEQFIIKTSEIGGSRNMLTLLRKKKFKTYSQDYTFPLILKAYILQLINRKYWKTGPKLKNLF